MEAQQIRLCEQRPSKQKLLLKYHRHNTLNVFTRGRHATFKGLKMRAD